MGAMKNDGIEMTRVATQHVEDTQKQSSGFAIHEETERTVEEKKIEKRLVLKLDMILMPFLGTIYFLASMVSRLQIARTVID
jgi:hypothetical protein